MQNKTLPRDVFMHLLAMAALYVSAISLMTLLFQYVNLAFPDVLESYYIRSVAQSIRWAMAGLIVVFPVYLLATWILQRDYRVYPEKRDLGIRKWLVYLTLFVAAVTIISDLVSLVYNFLGGDLTTRFVLKVLIVLVVAAAVFWFYLWDLKKKFNSGQLRRLAQAAAAVALVSVMAGFFTAGSPLKARLYRFDDRRISDLQSLQFEILNYWQQKDRLPQSLADLTDDLRGFAPPRDPSIDESYGYRVQSGLTFELCANFDLDSTNQAFPAERAVYPAGKTGFSVNWDHAAGEHCFARTIDPELYKLSR